MKVLAPIFRVLILSALLCAGISAPILAQQIATDANCGASYAAVKDPETKPAAMPPLPVVVHTPHEEFVLQATIANQRYPQMNTGIRIHTLGYLLKKQPTPVGDFLQQITDEDMKVIGEAMDRVHKAMGVKYQQHLTMTPEQHAEMKIRAVRPTRLKGLLRGTNAGLEFNLIKTLKFLSPQFKYSPLNNLTFRQVLNDEAAVVKAIQDFLDMHPELTPKLQRIGESLSQILKHPELTEAFTVYRRRLRPGAPDEFGMVEVFHERKKLSDKIEAVTLDRLTSDLPEHSREEWTTWLRSVNLDGGE